MKFENYMQQRPFSGPTGRQQCSQGQCPTAIKLSLEALVTRARSQAPAWERFCFGGSSLPLLSGVLCFWRSGRRLEPPGILHSQAGAWERARVSRGSRLNLMAVGQCPGVCIDFVPEKPKGAGGEVRGAHPSRMLAEANFRGGTACGRQSLRRRMRFEGEKFVSARRRHQHARRARSPESRVHATTGSTNTRVQAAVSPQLEALQ